MYYYQRDPASWQMGQQQRRDQIFRNMMNMYMSQREMGREEDWRQQVMRPYYEARTAEMRRPPQPRAMTEWEYKDAIARQTMSPEQYRQWRLGLPKPFQQQLEEAEKLSEARAKGTAKGKPREKPKPEKSDYSKKITWIGSVMTRFGRERDRLIRAYEKAERPTVKVKLETSIQNLDEALTQFERVRMIWAAGNPVSPEDELMARKIAADINRVKSGKIWETKPPQPEIPEGTIRRNKQTGERQIFKNGKWQPYK